MKTKNNILIIGSKGMLGQALVETFKQDADYEVIGWDVDDIDITNQKQVNQKISKLKPNIILNAAAYNAVDKCETDKKEFALAKKLNGDAPGYLAGIAKKIKAILVHYSTDYVFDGQPDIEIEPVGCSHSCGSCKLHDNFQPEIGFKEEAKPNPLSNYGKSKLLGEKTVQKAKGQYYIIRLSKLFGKSAKADGAKRSFFDVMLEQAKKNKKVQAVDEEISCFTYAPDLARKTKELIESKKPFGIFHITNSGACTWYAAAAQLYKLAKIKTKILPVSSIEFPRPAERPFISTLVNTKLNPLRSWEEALKDYLKSRKA